MKHCFLIAALLLAGPLSAQVVFEPHFIDPCTGKDVTDSAEWYVWNDSIGESDPWEIPFQQPDTVAAGNISGRGYAPDPFYTAYRVFPDSVLSAYQGKRIVFLQPGEYDLFISYELPIHLDLRSPGTIRDTFFYYPYEHVCGSLYFGGCETLNDGKLLSHYHDGGIRLSGTFENGALTDTLRLYYPSGRLFTLIVPRRKEFHTLTYYENGVLQSDVLPGRSISWYENGIVESDCKKSFSKYYNEAGQLIRSSRSRNFKSIHYTYHPNGKLQSSIYTSRNSYGKLVYTGEGILKESICRTRPQRTSGDKSDKLFEWTRFNAKGKREQTILLQTNNYYFPLEDHRKLLEKGDIRKVTVYRNGKKTTCYVYSGDDDNPGYNVFTRKGMRWKMTGNTDANTLRQIIVSQ